MQRHLIRGPVVGLRQLACATLFASLLALGACSSGGGGGGDDSDGDSDSGGGGGTAATPTLLYTANGNDGAISVLIVDADGQLKHLSYHPVTGVFSWLEVIVHPDGDKLLALAGDTLYSFTIDAASGALTQVDSVATGTDATDVILNTAGTLAYVANSGGNSVSLIGIDAAGQLTDRGTVATGDNPVDIRIHPNGSLFYTVNRNDEDVSVFPINADGSLGAQSQAYADTFSVTAIAFTPDGNYAYVTRAENNDNLQYFDVNTTTGALTPMGTVSVGNTPLDVEVDAAGAYAYTANANGDNVSLLSIAANGVPTFEQNYPSGDNTQEVAFSPDGDTLYANAVDDGDVTVFMIGFNGGLTQLERVRMRGQPRSLAFRTGTGTVAYNSERVYVPVAGDSMVYIFPRDVSTGVLSASTTTTAGTGPKHVTFHPNGDYAYVINDGSVDIHAFSVDVDTGALSGIGVSALANLVDDNLVRMAIEPSGRFLYALDNRAGLGNGGIVFQFDINANGTLAFNAGGNRNTGNNPENLVMHPTGRFVYSLNSFGDSITTFEIGEFDGALTQRQTFTTGDRPFNGQVHPNGRWLYVTLENDAEIARYTLDDNNGSLSNEQTYNSSSPAQTKHLAIHPSGDWIYVTADDRTIATYSVDGNGVPTFDSLITPSAAQGNADWISITPDGMHAYAASNAGIMHFTIDPASGAIQYQTTTAEAASSNYQQSLTLDFVLQ